MNAIFERASVRQFTDAEVTEDQIKALLKAAMAAPSAGNGQPWSFYVVRDEVTRQEISTISPYAGPAGRANIALVLAMTPDEKLRFPECKAQDMAAATENILLEATNLGLGAVWLGVYPEVDRMEALSAAVKFENGEEPFCVIALGHPAGEVTPHGVERFDESRIHWL